MCRQHTVEFRVGLYRPIVNSPAVVLIVGLWPVHTGNKVVENGDYVARNGDKVTKSPFWATNGDKVAENRRNGDNLSKVHEY